MTLSTSLVVIDPMDPKAVFDFTLALVAEDFPRVPTWEHRPPGERPGDYVTTCGQGLPAWLFVHYGTDGPLTYYDREEVEEYGRDDPDFTVPPCNEHCIRINWDTGYSYRGPSGEGCGDLHARYIATVGRWLDEQGKTWWWHNEFTGEWHKGTDGLDALGNAGAEAKAWMVGTVLPAFEAGLL